MRKPPLECLNFARAVLTLLIVFYHSCCYLSKVIGSGYFDDVATSALGSVTVSAFFALSGLVIKRNNCEVGIWEFYKKRFFSIYPSFWIAWGVVYLLRVISTRSFFYNGNKWSIILSFLGLDGYLGGAYYCVGEWFLGAIIIMYLCSPFLLWLYKRMQVIGHMVLGAAYYVVISKDYFGVSDFRHILVCAMSFWIGMLLADNIEKIVDNGVLFIVLLWTIWHVKTGHSPFTVYTGVIIRGVCVLLAVGMIGRVIKNPIVIRFFSLIRKISFQIFLVHAVVLSSYARWMGAARLQSIWVKGFFEISAFIIIVVLAYGLFYIDKKIKNHFLKR